MSLELESLQQQVRELQNRVEFVETGSRRERRRLRVQAGLALTALVGVTFALPGSRSAIAQGYGVTLATLNNRLLALEAKTQFQYADSITQSTTFSGCNLFVNDGGGATSAIVHNAAGQGLGNLIVGYNAFQGSGQDMRTGSHNLIIGDQNNYTSYGGLVSGESNWLLAPYGSINGGYSNFVQGSFAATLGGAINSASGSYSSVSGGNQNTATGAWASAGGGFANQASGTYASISGGEINEARGYGSAISGGLGNIAGGQWSAISGGIDLFQTPDYGWAAGGGFGNTVYHVP